MAVRSLSISDATVFLRESGYRRKVFTEPSPGMVARYGRRTCRSGAGCVMPWAVEPVRDLASARACWLALDTAHQLHQRRPATLVQAPRVLSIDDCAWRKGPSLWHHPMRSRNGQGGRPASRSRCQYSCRVTAAASRDRDHQWRSCRCMKPARPSGAASQSAAAIGAMEQVRKLFLKIGAPDQELARKLGIDHQP